MLKNIGKSIRILAIVLAILSFLGFAALGTFFLLAALCLSGGCAERGDYFAPFSGGYRAQLRGTLHALSFEGELTLSAPDSEGRRGATFLFYAPETLKGATLTRNEKGELSLTVGRVTVGAGAAGGYAPLLDAFPDGGEVSEVLPQGERTQLRGDDFVLELLPNGTPARIEREALCAEVLHFARTE